MLYTIKETSSQLVNFSTMVFRYQEKHSCTLTSVEKIQINMLMKGKQPTTQPSEQSCSLGTNPCVTWHINLSSAHAHHCLKKEKANYSVLVRSSASESPVIQLIPQSRACSVKSVPLLRERLEEGETCQHQLWQQERSWNKAAAAASETAGLGRSHTSQQRELKPLGRYRGSQGL